MCAAFFSLLGSLAQANFVWNGDIVLNVAMAGGGVDWLGLLGLAIIIGVAWVIASRSVNGFLANGNGVSERGPRLRMRHRLILSGTKSSEGVSYAIFFSRLRERP